MSSLPENLEAALARLPYARFIGVRGVLHGDELTLVLPYAERNIGNPMLPALHGGVIGAFMEIAAITQLAVSSNAHRLPRTIDVNMSYLRSGRPADTFARARVLKIGRRIASVQVEAWQNMREQPIAQMNGNFLVATAEGEKS